ncbi:MAG: recombinase family protein [Finegoldia magna]|uniref:recombinase family protein n=1 Tax=Finegoldia magna TaxID=1260 RepID=UPI0026EE50A4|nr:recombinase family protein [Finegoldia magna]MBS5966316.1 recombinase family protein [Finegoldia magna]
MYKIGIYMRLSKEDYEKNEESNSIKNQRQLILSYIDKNFSDFCVDNKIEYIDDGYSGMNTNRPAFKRLMEDIRDLNTNCIIVKDLSRFSRDYIETGNYLENIFPFLGIRFISINDGFDSKDNCNGTIEIDTQFKSLLYDYYSKELSEKIKLTLNSLKSKGKIINEAPFGYVKDPKNKYKIIKDDISAKVVRKAFDMILEGHSQGSIAKNFNKEKYLTGSERKRVLRGESLENYKKILWTTGQISRILRNESYTGVFLYNKTCKTPIRKSIPRPKEEWGRIENAFEPIISKVEFNKVQDILNQRSFSAHNDTRDVDSPLRSKVICGVCGHKMKFDYRAVVGKNGKKYDCRFRCRICSLNSKSNSISSKAVESYVLESLKRRGVRLEERKTIKSKKVDQGKVNALKFEIQKNYELYLDSKLTREEFLVIKNNINEQLSSLKEESETKDKLENITMCNIDLKLTNEIVEDNIKEIIVDASKNIEIVYK